MKKILYISFLLIFVGHLQAQKKGYSDGYVVTFQNDTIYGLIKSKNKVASGKSVSFIFDSGDKGKYKPQDIKLYSKTRKTYRSFQLPMDSFGFRGYAFLQELVKGSCSLYVQYTSTASSDGTGTIAAFYYLLLEDSQEMIRVNALKFKNQVSEFVKDNNELSTMILNKEYRFDDIEEIVKIYNEGQ